MIRRLAIDVSRSYQSDLVGRRGDDRYPVTSRSDEETKKKPSIPPWRPDITGVPTRKTPPLPFLPDQEATPDSGSPTIP